MTMHGRFLRIAVWVLVTLSLALTSCGGRDRASPTSPLLVAGDNHSVAMKKDGTLWAWGYNNFGQLGNGTNTDSRTPIQVGGDTEWLSAAAGTWHTVAIKADGSFWAWRLNQDGQFGNGTHKNSHTPIQIGR
jgi:alpha-tubulin suppressor-like RCC1 family protein